MIRCVDRLLTRERSQSDSSEDVFLSDQQADTSKRGSQGNAFWINPGDCHSTPLTSSHPLTAQSSSPLLPPSSSPLLNPACPSNPNTRSCRFHPVLRSVLIPFRTAQIAQMLSVLHPLNSTRHSKSNVPYFCLVSLTFNRRGVLFEKDLCFSMILKQVLIMEIICLKNKLKCELNVTFLDT